MDQDDTVKRAFPPAISLPIYIGFQITHLRALSSKTYSFEQADDKLRPGTFSAPIFAAHTSADAFFFNVCIVRGNSICYQTAMKPQPDYKMKMRFRGSVKQMFDVKHNVCSHKCKVHLSSRGQIPLSGCEGERVVMVQQLSEST